MKVYTNTWSYLHIYWQYQHYNSHRLVMKFSIDEIDHPFSYAVRRYPPHALLFIVHSVFQLSSTSTSKVNGTED